MRKLPKSRSQEADIIIAMIRRMGNESRRSSVLPSVQTAPVHRGTVVQLPDVITPRKARRSSPKTH